MSGKTTFIKVKEEQNQGIATRRELYNSIEEKLGRPIVSYCTSFVHDVLIDDGDAIMLEDLLRPMSLEKGVALFINSPGGYALAAERIIQILREYSGTGEYLSIVAGKAKSAATMICLGSSKILMDSTSELGPVDPQIQLTQGNSTKVYSVYNLIKSYEDLFRGAIQEEGNLEPYLQQLQNYDARDIEEHRSALGLSEDISIQALKSGMMSSMGEALIRRKIKNFLTPKKVKSHGRAIYAEEVKKCGLNVEIKPLKDDTWSQIYELYYRINNLLSTTSTSKLIESKNSSFFVAAGGV
ncbi:MAG: hypothetical protein OXG10_01425 [Candidatus Dadabacteria bacterium]|nr:hypothetical protein [Candidatus Dadabacteria bacterium]